MAQEETGRDLATEVMFLVLLVLVAAAFVVAQLLGHRSGSGFVFLATVLSIAANLLRGDAEEVQEGPVAGTAIEERPRMPVAVTIALSIGLIVLLGTIVVTLVPPDARDQIDPFVQGLALAILIVPQWRRVSRGRRESAADARGVSVTP